ncbi:TcmI family type II polyketide cyclase [Streptomyces alkaliterrae]|uniref:TcmI family type II polyketide cyclase n=1 Tax=Streptomyces alkaliterrae TaxID=2213162 RepID=A0A5P0YSZ5_9ACTN|nr:TcmI family type II polyketide cyclase [Streptomyces alkaliterrae]MBB1253377.1 TcmI family type II polyketide cyclase [Streptomyces alkaliterrae]MBB1259171.1 TcmI family type II polyketide cyclase [Streptomyces alkaliterrae]MQS01599.1 TcmI family type II polyketide cyclase [Streptomyces alkaliterrae]
MTHRLLVVARIKPGSQSDVARLFARSDGTELPAALGVVRRDLYEYHGLYFHHVEFAGDPREAVSRARRREDFQELSAELDAFVTPYEPRTWRSPLDAMATGFYSWTPESGRQS